MTVLVLIYFSAGEWFWLLMLCLRVSLVINVVIVVVVVCCQQHSIVIGDLLAADVFGQCFFTLCHKRPIVMVVVDVRQ